MKKIVLAIVALGLVSGASACNTVKGMGEDVQSVGEAGDRAT